MDKKVELIQGLKKQLKKTERKKTMNRCLAEPSVTKNIREGDWTKSRYLAK